MKLKKSVLVSKLKRELEDFGYSLIKDSITGADIMFIKGIQKDFFLSLGITISNFYESKFTATYYLSKSTRWGSVWGDIPLDSYVRIGKFLTDKEREFFLSKEYCLQGVKDAWWNGTDFEISNFLEVVKITEIRFLKQEDLFYKINISIEVKEFVNLTSSVYNLLSDINKKNEDEYNYKFIPKKLKDNIPIEIYKSSEKALNIRSSNINPKIVEALAGDIWRQTQLKTVFHQRLG